MISAAAIVSAQLLTRRLANGLYRIDADGALEKRCAQCRDYWPADEEFFFTGRGYRDGLHCYCKACYIERRWPHGRRGTLHHLNGERHVQGTAPAR